MAILIIEDDFFYGSQLAEMMNDNGIEVLRARSAQEALQTATDTYDAAIIDVMLPNDPSASGISVEESRAGFLTGVVLARRLRKQNPHLRIVLLTGDVWGAESEEWAQSQSIPIVMKSDGKRAIHHALQELGVLKRKSGPQAFIVHGHDETALFELKNYLQNTLHWPEPIVLREQPNCGRTVIEKFEDFSGRIDCVFVMLTPDDSTNDSDPRRSRQNVIFELGFFFAQLGRQSGRVIVLHKGPNELPSDIEGIIWIGIAKGIETAGEQIRREVAAFMKGSDGQSGDDGLRPTSRTASSNLA